jgi:hypothetical protein
MTSTYGDITVGSVWDGDVITSREVFAGGNWEFIRLTTRTGGRRTEAADFPVDSLTGVRIAEPLLIDVPDDQLLIGAGVFAEHVKAGYGDLLTGLHGIALEMHRRRALDCITRGCRRADSGCVCHMRDAETDGCPGHYDDDHALLHGEYYCDGTCQA